MRKATSETTQERREQLLETLRKIKERDNELTTALRSALWLAHPFGGNEAAKKSFVAEVQELINEMALVARNIFDFDPSEYYWLEDTAGRWKFICETAVGLSIDLPVFGERLVTLVNLDDRGISRFVQYKAHKISELRRHAKAVKVLEETMRARYQETTADEERWDWLQAERYFGKDMMYGTGDLYRYADLGDVRAFEIWKYLHADTFDRLETIWLSDVFALRAYECWLERGAPVTSDKAIIDMDYEKALSQYWDRVLDDTIKYPVEARGTLGKYLEERLGLGKGPIFAELEPFSVLIEKKARRIEELNGYKDRRRAEKYVTDFYRALYAAAMSDNSVAKKQLVSGFKEGVGYDGNKPIASCFEALIMVYYVRGAREAFGAAEAYPPSGSGRT